MADIPITDLKTAILAELAQASPNARNKFNLIGRAGLQRGPLEHRLEVTFSADQRALAARAFDEMKTQDLIRPTYEDLADPENWVTITDAGKLALETKQFKTGMIVGQGKFGVQDTSTLREKISQSEKQNKPISLLFLDLDNFKSVNDDYDHDTGDQVIKESLAIIQGIIEGKGELFHRSGDEMIVLLPNFNDNEAYALATRIQQDTEHHAFPTIGAGVITVTIGLATFPANCLKPEELTIAADRAAMSAKKIRKNSIRRHKQELENGS